MPGPEDRGDVYEPDRERVREEIERFREEIPKLIALDQAFSSISQERRRQDEKWGEQNHPDPVWLAILTEEVGEAAQEVLTKEFGDAAKGHGSLREELVHVAAVAAAWIECLDRNGA
jgi:NTP pyrophosphatase (non-canonical NTP hydrolase)